MKTLKSLINQPLCTSQVLFGLQRHNSRVALRDNTNKGFKRDFSIQGVCDRIDCQMFHYLVSYITGNTFHVGEACHTIYHCKIINVPCV